MNDEELNEMNAMQGHIQALTTVIGSIILSMQPERANLSAETLQRLAQEEEMQDIEDGENATTSRAKMTVLNGRIGILQSVAARA